MPVKKHYGHSKHYVSAYTQKFLETHVATMAGIRKDTCGACSMGALYGVQQK